MSTSYNELLNAPREVLFGSHSPQSALNDGNIWMVYKNDFRWIHWTSNPFNAKIDNCLFILIILSKTQVSKRINFWEQAKKGREIPVPSSFNLNESNLSLFFALLEHRISFTQAVFRFAAIRKMSLFYPIWRVPVGERLFLNLSRFGC